MAGFPPFSWLSSIPLYTFHTFFAHSSVSECLDGFWWLWRILKDIGLLLSLWDTNFIIFTYYPVEHCGSMTPWYRWLLTLWWPWCLCLWKSLFFPPYSSCILSPLIVSSTFIAPLCAYWFPRWYYRKTWTLMLPERFVGIWASQRMSSA